MKTTRSGFGLALGFTVASVGLLTACQPPAEKSDVEVKPNTDGVNPNGYTVSGDTSGGSEPAYEPSGSTTTTTTTTYEKDGTTTTKTTKVYSYCAPVTVYGYYKITTADAPGNTRLTQVTNGTVPCVNTESFKQTTCKYAGGYVTDAKGSPYARVGQAISLGGYPGGDAYGVWVVAAKVTATSTLRGTRYSVPCVAPSSKDSAGVSSGAELAGACILESLNASTNSAGVANQNFATLDVCAQTGSNTDGAATDASAEGGATSSYEKYPGVTCYTGLSAGLNDNYGTERDKSGIYVPGADHCHVAWSNGYEVPAAKRPSTGGWPTRVYETSPIAWRPVISSLRIANP